MSIAVLSDPGLIAALLDEANFQYRRGVDSEDERPDHVEGPS
jgi:hypothetical protein